MGELFNEYFFGHLLIIDEAIKGFLFGIILSCFSNAMANYARKHLKELKPLFSNRLSLKRLVKSGLQRFNSISCIVCFCKFIKDVGTQ
jgi:hypothetical protein